MSLELYLHPLASYCWKVLIAFYENGTPFEPRIVDDASRPGFEHILSLGKFPVLRDGARDRTIPESSIIIEYLAQHYPGPIKLLPDSPELALETRLADRFYDLYVHESMQKIVADKIRPAGKSDPYGVEQARARLATAYEMIDRNMEAKTWSVGDTFTMADCAAAPALYYADLVAPFRKTFTNAAAYLRRLEQRPSFARVIQEAQPYFALFPG